MKIHRDLDQGSDEWLAARCGLLTASEMKLIMTPTGKPASNDKERSHFYELLAQRITGYVEPKYISDDMLRGTENEIFARALYEDKASPVEQVGFITDDRFGFTIGYSPDGLVGDDGLIEIKSRRQKFQVETLLNYEMPSDYAIQVQTGLLVTQRKWCDFLSYCGGMPMPIIRVFPDLKMQEAIFSAAIAFETRLRKAQTEYQEKVAAMRCYPTERRVEQEMYA